MTQVLDQAPARKLRETSGPTVLSLDDIPDGFLLSRFGSTVIGIDPDDLGGGGAGGWTDADAGIVHLVSNTDYVLIGADARTSHAGDQEWLLVKKDQNSSTIIRVENYDTTASGHGEATLAAVVDGNRGGVILAMGSGAVTANGYGALETVFSTYGTMAGLVLRGSNCPIRIVGGNNDRELFQFATSGLATFHETVDFQGIQVHGVFLGGDQNWEGSGYAMQYEAVSTPATVLGYFKTGLNSGAAGWEFGNDNGKDAQIGLYGSTYAGSTYGPANAGMMHINCNTGMIIGTTSTESIYFAHNSAARLELNGGLLKPYANNGVQLGDASYKFSTLYSTTLNTGDLNMDDDKKDSHWTLREAKEEGEDRDSLYAINRRTSEKFKVLLQAA